ncbi:hypothetical protein [Flavobacterium sedimenticola]|uniref:Uncharacterized protein n=1 Tax=Flavobacterium sedimenticola TaxID=3043286 RepID=A0ABT6XQL5_9FLAO|nr:hypothetical protein [Flavobacterium sedimenticola]MDI9257272.1 hypothetical protein [Flavobacterium sedimenticola]
MSNTETKENINISQISIERHKRVWEALFYAHQRMDILIITISGAGIYVSLEAMKYFHEKNIEILPSLKIGSIFFVVSIIFNFIAQKLSSKVHFYDYQIYDIEVTCEVKCIDSNEYKKILKKLNKKSKRTDKENKAFNRLSIVSMFLGLIYLIYFFVTTF